jgi:hypothetical protein
VTTGNRPLHRLPDASFLGRELRGVLLRLFVAAAAAGCGAAAEREAPAAPVVTATNPDAITTIGSGAAGPIDWGKPLPETESFPELAEAAERLSFPPLQPGGLGHPAKILVTRADITSASERFLVYVYDHPLFGIFYVQQRQLEGPRDEAQASLEALGSPDWCPRGHVCPAKRSLVELANGQTALLVLSPSSRSGTNFIEFLSPVSPVRVEVVGPPDTFDAGDAATVADLLIEAAGRPS